VRRGKAEEYAGGEAVNQLLRQELFFWLWAFNQKANAQTLEARSIMGKQPKLEIIFRYFCTKPFTCNNLF
jgi:hypothetical protein